VRDSSAEKVIFLADDSQLLFGTIRTALYETWSQEPRKISILKGLKWLRRALYVVLSGIEAGAEMVFFDAMEVDALVPGDHESGSDREESDWIDV
jgi:hypothetical protein